jgi:hypothetical protein
VLGLFESSTLLGGDLSRRAKLLAGVRAVLVDGTPPDARTASLAALLSGSGTLPQFSPGIPWTSAVIARAKELERGDWGADAAAEAVARTTAAVILGNLAVAASIVPRS